MSKKNEDTNNKNYGFQKLIQERIDELYLLEKKAEDRAIVFQEEGVKLAKMASLAIDKVSELNYKTTDSIKKINETSQQITKDLEISQNRLHKSTKMLIVSIITTVICIAFFVIISIHYGREASSARSDLSYLEKKISKTPVVITHNNKSYVMIRPETEQDLISPNGSIGTFAELQFYQRK